MNVLVAHQVSYPTVVAVTRCVGVCLSSQSTAALFKFSLTTFCLENEWAAFDTIQLFLRRDENSKTIARERWTSLGISAFSLFHLDKFKLFPSVNIIYLRAFTIYQLLSVSESTSVLPGLNSSHEIQFNLFIKDIIVNCQFLFS